ncbi:hypothetical protein GCWU000282_02733 [Catonella morbi ATCC 51271]|uniref:Uncharacterized protein n=1 Tax=Catonella morbi ATCC 51271 TaxID=592026 RepID=V2Z4R0_9FIRM|nr:hypothetical protein GCWU000282_02733 [Catonella morbi ATCC 51271]
MLWYRLTPSFVPGAVQIFVAAVPGDCTNDCVELIRKAVISKAANINLFLRFFFIIKHLLFFGLRYINNVITYKYGYVYTKSVRKKRPVLVYQF